MNAEIEILGAYLPWWVVIGVIAYAAAWLTVRGMEHFRLTRFVWHLPLFFLALVVIFYSAFGLALAP